jgi:hypothetical protein
MVSAVKYIVDSKGQKTAVLVPLKECEAMQKQQAQLEQKLAAFNSIRDGLQEVREAKKSGKKLQTLKDFLG